MNNTRRTVKKLQQVVNSIEINNDLLSNISSNKGDTATLSAFSASIVNNVITSADLNRKAVEIYNNSSTNILYVSKNNISSLTLFSPVSTIFSSSLSKKIPASIIIINTTIIR